MEGNCVHETFSECGLRAACNDFKATALPEWGFDFLGIELHMPSSTRTFTQ